MFRLFVDIVLHLKRSRLLYENTEKTWEKQGFFKDFALLEVQTVRTKQQNEIKICAKMFVLT